MHAFAKPLLIGAFVASCAWAVHGLREAQTPSAEAVRVGAATTASMPDSPPALARWPAADHVEPVPSAPPDTQSKPSNEPRPGTAPPPARGGPGAPPLHEATTSTPATPAPPPAAASIALPVGVTTQDVAISPAGMLAVMRRAPDATPSSDGAAYGAAAAGRPAAVMSQ